MFQTLQSALGRGPSSTGLADADLRAETVRGDVAVPSSHRLVALALANLSRAVARARAGTGTAGADDPEQTTDQPGDFDVPAAPVSPVDAPGQATHGSWLARLSPSTRQAVQVAVAASLAIVAGELLSPARWYWAVIAAFDIYSGTVTRGQTLTKGGQRIVGTIAVSPSAPSWPAWWPGTSPRRSCSSSCRCSPVSI